MIRLEIFGTPSPQGSKVRFPNGALVDGTSKTGRRKLADWRQAVTAAAGGAVPEHGCLRGPVSLTVTFRFLLPKTDRYRTLHASKPDIDKLLRSTLDGLTSGGLIGDDALVCQVATKKRYCGDGEAPGATVDLVDLAPVEARSREAKKADAAQARRRPVPSGQQTLAGAEG